MLGRLERGGEERRALAVVPGTVIAADRVVVRDRAAGGNERIRCSGLDVSPLLDERAVAAQCMEAEIRRGTVGIDVGEAAGDLARAPGGGDVSLLPSAALRCRATASKRSQVMAVSKVSLMMARGTMRSRA